jgi:hypothetical protein
VKKYKLIKEYPGSPELGVTADKKDVCDFWYINDGFNNIGKNIDQFPEFWEEVVEKDYKILSIISTKHNLIIKEGLIRIINSPKTYTHKYNRKADAPWNIHSVKRLSDDEIFTVGDNIWRKEWSIAAYPPISAIKINHEDKIIIHTLHSVSYLPQIMKKVKKLLFTTEDGVEIFEGDEYFKLYKYPLRLGGIETAFISSGKHFDLFLYFSTKEKAEEYILMNKPCLSINDLLNIGLSFISLKELKKLVKSKL